MSDNVVYANRRLRQEQTLHYKEQCTGDVLLKSAYPSQVILTLPRLSLNTLLLPSEDSLICTHTKPKHLNPSPKQDISSYLMHTYIHGY